jgi:hypothetical protein
VNTAAHATGASGFETQRGDCMPFFVVPDLAVNPEMIEAPGFYFVGATDCPVLAVYQNFRIVIFPKGFV